MENVQCVQWGRVWTPAPLPPPHNTPSAYATEFLEQVQIISIPWTSDADVFDDDTDDDDDAGGKVSSAVCTEWQVTCGTVVMTFATVTFPTVVFSAGRPVVRECEGCSFSLSIMIVGRTAFGTYNADSGISFFRRSCVTASQSIDLICTSSAAMSRSVETIL